MNEASVGAGGSAETSASATQKTAQKATVDISKALEVSDELARLAEALQQLEIAYRVGHHSMAIRPQLNLEKATLYKKLKSRQSELLAALVAMG
jgi:hypothetical protein